MPFESTILVTAAGGHVGHELIPQLLQGNVKLVLPTSNARRLQSKLPQKATEENVAIEQGSISDALWIESIIARHTVDKVFLVLTGTDELMVTLNFFDAMKRAGSVKHLVYLSASGDYVSDTGFRRVVTQHAAVHVLVKPMIERKLAYSGYPWTTNVLGPTLFWDNDLRSKDFMLSGGFFDEPLGERGVSRVATGDIALAARNVLMDPKKWTDKKIMIGSLRIYTGKEIAGFWSKALGKHVKMCKSDAQGFTHAEEIFLNKTKNAGWARDIKLMYEAFAEFGFGMTEEEYELQLECLGREPLDYEQFVAETGKAWRF